jgi:hypothetical protein
MDMPDRLTRIWDADLFKTLLLCAALGLGTGWFASARAPSLRWGDVPTWIAVIAAGLALYFATAAARSVHALLRVEQARETRREIADQAFQARHIGAWHQASYFAATLRNGSTLPVYDVTVEFLGPGGALWEKGLLDVLPPGEQILPWTGDASPSDDVAGDSRHGPRDCRLAVNFTDTAGNRWRRSERGELRSTSGAASAG